MKATDLMLGFKYIPNYEGLYSIDKMGNVYSHISGKILRPHANHRGYLMVDLWKNGNVKKGIIHRLVAQTYIPNPDNLPEIDHIDTNRQNNNVSNLRWCTRKENNNNPITRARISQKLTGTKRTPEQRERMKAAQQKAKPMLGKKHSAETLEKFKKRKPSKICPVDMLDIYGNLLKTFNSITEASLETGIKASNITTCCKGRLKTSGGYIWKYKEKENII